MISLDTIPIPAKNVVGRIIKSEPDGHEEAVLVLPSVGQVKVMNEIGGRIWSLADGKRTVGEIAALICKQYAVDLETAQSDTMEFIDILQQRGILTLSTRTRGE